MSEYFYVNIIISNSKYHFQIAQNEKFNYNNEKKIRQVENLLTLKISSNDMEYPIVKG